MAATNPAGFFQARSDHSALVMRRAFMSLVDGANAGATTVYGGVNPTYGNRLFVQGSASAMQVTVFDGMCIVPSSTAYAGPYFCYNDANVTLTLAASSGTQYRRDYIVAQVLDTAAGDGSDQWQLAVVQGSNSASSPAPLPALPNRSIPLAVVRVDPTITNLTGKVDDFRTYYSNIGVLSCYAGTRPSAPHQGLLTADFDFNKQLSYYDGSAYRYVADAGWQSYTITLAGFGSATFSSQTGRYKYVGDKAIAVQGQLTGTNAGTGSAFLQVGLPVAPARTIRQIFTLYAAASGESSPRVGIIETFTGGSGLLTDRVRRNDTSTGTATAMVGTDFTAGYALWFSGVYETT